MSALIAVTAGFVSGLGLRSLFVFGWQVVVALLVLALIFVGVRYVKPRPRFTLAILFFIAAALGMVRASFADTPLPSNFASHIGERVQYAGTIVADPDVRENSQRITLQISRGGETTRMLAVAKKDVVLSVGERVWVSGTLALPQPFDTEGGRVFRYDKYLERDGIRFMLNFAYIRIDTLAPWYSLPAFLARIKHTFLDGLSIVLPDPYAALAGGIVIGGKTGLPTELQTAFIHSGLVQIIVLSGYNVMVVATWIMSLLSLTKLSRRWVTISGAVSLTLFVGIAGFSATAIRATLMALIALYARATGRTYDAGRALLFAILLMLIWNPLYLVFDPGFGLSVAATAGLIWLSPLIEVRLAQWSRFLRVMPSAAFLKGKAKRSQKMRPLSDFWRQILATTFAAQLAVLPLLLYDMGILSLVAVPANILVAPVIPLAMGWSVIAGFAGILFGGALPILASILAAPTFVLMWFIIKVATVSSSFSMSAVMLPAFPFWVVLLAYALIVYRAMLASKRFSGTAQFTFAKKAST